MRRILNIPFEWGKIIITPATNAAIPDVEIMRAFGRHVSGDWGDASDDDWEINNGAVIHGSGLIHSIHKSRAGTTFWLITKADRSVTTVILPSEY